MTCFEDGCDVGDDKGGALCASCVGVGEGEGGVDELGVGHCAWVVEYL